MPAPKTPDLAQILVDLADPAAYPHPVNDVQVIQTHISCVFLTGEYAYKVKKPVDFGFLDYRTLESRHEFCKQEILLNQRLCPEIYIDTVRISLQGGRLKVDGEGECVEWAVKMRQLRAEDMLAARLEAYSAGEAEIRRIAHILADFHARAADNPQIRVWGESAAIARTMTNTLDVMDMLSGELLSSHTRSGIRCALQEVLDQEKVLLRQRMETGRVRDCHGDLRLQNICLDSRYEGGIQIFDCIEFNEEFRSIDIAADLAYLAMDLDLAGRAELREALVDAYYHASGDNSLHSMLRFYRMYRACVRGNIALLAARETEIPERQREVQHAIAAAAYDLARCCARKHTAPALIITIGYSGSGKSALAYELSRRLPAVHLSSDRIRKETAGVAETTPLEKDYYTAARRSAVYQELYRRAEGYLARGEHVILDASFLSAHERSHAKQVAQAHAAEFWILECQCPDEVIRLRLELRKKEANASDAGIAVYEEQLHSYVPVALLSEERSTRRLVVNTNQPAYQAAHGVVDMFAVL